MQLRTNRQFCVYMLRERDISKDSSAHIGNPEISVVLVPVSDGEVAFDGPTKLFVLVGIQSSILSGAVRTAVPLEVYPFASVI